MAFLHNMTGRDLHLFKKMTDMGLNYIVDWIINYMLKCMQLFLWLNGRVCKLFLNFDPGDGTNRTPSESQKQMQTDLQFGRA